MVLPLVIHSGISVPSKHVFISLSLSIYIYIHIYINRIIGPVDRVFGNDPGDLGSIPGRVIPKTLKWYLIHPCLTLSNIRYVSRVKWSNSGKVVAPSPTPRCSSYCKGRFLVALDLGRQLYFYLYIMFKIQNVTAACFFKKLNCLKHKNAELYQNISFILKIVRQDNNDSEFHVSIFKC